MNNKVIIYILLNVCTPLEKARANSAFCYLICGQIESIESVSTKTGLKYALISLVLFAKCFIIENKLLMYSLCFYSLDL